MGSDNFLSCKLWTLEGRVYYKILKTKRYLFNPLSANPLLKPFGKLPTNCLSVFVHFVGWVLKGLIVTINKMVTVYESTNIPKFQNELETR